MKDLNDRLAAEEQDEELDELLNDCLRDLRISREYMSRYYSGWDKSLATYCQHRHVDADDVRSRRKQEPAKQTIPLSFAQVNTFVTYLTLLFTQNPDIFELVPTGTEDVEAKEESEAVVNREARQNDFVTLVVSFLLDVARFNMGVLKSSWDVQTFTPPAEAGAESFTLEFNGALLDITPTDEPEEITIREGTRVWNISPYNFFPDTRLPLVRWREGVFAADETLFHISDLKRWQKQGEAFGVEHIVPFRREAWRERGLTRLNDFDPLSRRRTNEKDFMVVTTEVQRRLVPKDYGFSEGKDEELWLIRIANDQRIISCKAMEDANAGFTYDMGMMSPDQHVGLEDSLSGLIDALQETVTFLLNSRIASVKQNLETKLVVHTAFIEMEDLKTRSPILRMKKNTPPSFGVNNFIQQLRTVDPTQSHVQDAETLMRVMQMVSGVNENAMGSFHSGRRSATEAKNVQSGAAGRMRVIAAGIWTMALQPLGRRFLLNARQWMSEETFFKIVGEDEDTYTAWETFHKDNWWELLGTEDYFVWDGTSASEKAYQAQSLQELALGLMSNPELLMATNIDLVKVVMEIQKLRGLKNLNAFKRDEQPIPNGAFPGQLDPAAAGEPGAGAAAVPAFPVA